MSGTPDPDGFGMIHVDLSADALAALGLELFQQNQCEEPYPSGGPIRGAAGSPTQYHPYLQMDSRNVSSDQQAVSIPVQTTTKLELKMEQQQSLPTHITAADTAATPMSLMHTLTQPMHMGVQPCHLGIPQSATPQSVMPPPPAQPPQGLWLPMDNFQMLCSLAGSRRDGDATLQQPVISQPAAPSMNRSSLLHDQLHRSHQQHLQQQVLQQQLQQTRMKASQPESTNQFVAPTGDSTSTMVMPAPFCRSFEDTERFLDEASAEVLGPSVHNAYECGYCGEIKLTASVGTIGTCAE